MVHSNVLSDFSISYPVSCNQGSQGRLMDTHFSWIRESVIGETYRSPAGHAGVLGPVYCLVGAGISSRSITDLTKYQGQAMWSLKYIKSGFKWPISISVSPVHSLDDGACHKHSLVGAGETIRRCITWPLGQPACGIRSSVSAARFPEWLLNGV